MVFILCWCWFWGAATFFRRQRVDADSTIYTYLFIHLNGVDARTLNIFVFVFADNVNGSVRGVAIHERNICIINWLNMLFTIRFQPLKIHSTLQHHREIERKTKMCVDHKLFIRASASVLILIFISFFSLHVSLLWFLYSIIFVFFLKFVSVNVVSSHSMSLSVLCIGHGFGYGACITCLANWFLSFEMPTHTTQSYLSRGFHVNFDILFLLSLFHINFI